MNTSEYVITEVTGRTIGVYMGKGGYFKVQTTLRENKKKCCKINRRLIYSICRFIVTL